MMVQDRGKGRQLLISLMQQIGGKKERSIKGTENVSLPDLVLMVEHEAFLLFSSEAEAGVEVVP